MVVSKSEFRSVLDNSAKSSSISPGCETDFGFQMWGIGTDFSFSNFLDVPWQLTHFSLPCLSLCCSPNFCGSFRRRQPKAAPRPLHSWLLLAPAQPPLFYVTGTTLFSLMLLGAGRMECCWLTHCPCCFRGHSHILLRSHFSLLSCWGSADFPFTGPKLCKGPNLLLSGNRRGGVVLFHSLPFPMLPYSSTLFLLEVSVSHYGL